MPIELPFGISTSHLINHWPIPLIENITIITYHVNDCNKYKCKMSVKLTFAISFRHLINHFDEDPNSIDAIR